MPTKTRFIPNPAEVRELPDANLTIYVYTCSNGWPAFVAYKGKRSKPIEHSRFQGADQLEATLARLIERERSNAAYSIARRNATHSLRVGDIVVSSWGYEQTNIDFFEVVRVPSTRSVVIREIEDETTSDGALAMTGSKLPKPGQFVAKAAESIHRATSPDTITGGSSRADYFKWDGKPKQFSSYA